MPLCHLLLSYLILQASHSPHSACSSLQSRLSWSWASLEDGGLSPPPPWTLYLHQHRPMSPGFSSSHTPVNFTSPPSAFAGTADKATLPPSTCALNFYPKCITFPSVHITFHLLNPTLRSDRSVGGRLCLSSLRVLSPVDMVGWCWLFFQAGQEGWHRPCGSHQRPLLGHVHS